MANILVIDDDKDILRLLEFALSRAGHSVTACTDGEQGLAQVKTQQPDLIVADVMMPKMTGYEFCRHVRAMPDGTDTPIIIFSARFQPVDKQTALQAGATDYLPKSTSPAELLKHIERLLPASAVSVAHQAIGFFSLRGGSGVTSLAINSAVALAVSRHSAIALVDMVKMGGHAAIMLGLRPTSHVANALASARDNLTLEAIKPHLIEHASGVHVLASVPTFQPDVAYSPNALKNLVDGLKPGYSYALFDLPPTALEANSAPILPALDKIALVLTPDMPSLQSTAIALQGLARLGIPENKIGLIVNHVIPHNALPIQTIQKAARRPVLAEIPFEPNMAKAINSGKPLMLSHPKCVAAAAIAKMSLALAEPA